MIRERYNQGAIAEEYIDGRELYVSVLGNKRLQVLPPRELLFGRSEEGGPVLATYKVKWDWEYREKWDIDFDDSELGEKETELVARVCRRAYRTMQLRDFGRIDLRLTPDNRVYILEVNPNPNLAELDELGLSAEKAGMAYPKLIDKVVRLAMNRHANGA
jgi:D-alanine-D-alanine ligase